MDSLSSRRLRLLPLQAAVALADCLGQILRSRNHSIRLPEIRKIPGVSVIVPERGNPALLAECLDSVATAALEVAEPVETIVVINGSDPRAYTEIETRHPSIRWVRCAGALGFSGAVRAGLRQARFEWVYLANNDVVLDRFALKEVLRWRAPFVFAVGSQILPHDPMAGRVETGWTDLQINEGLVEIFDAPPDDQETTRGALYAGGGCSLFQRSLLVEFAGSRDPYYPFYWEDVEWGARAWRRGLQVLFCPASKAWHRRRATIGQFYPAGEIERIFRRNGYLFQLRNLTGLGSIEKLWAKLIEVDPGSFKEVSRWRKLIGVFLARLRSALEPCDESVLAYARRSFHLLPPGEPRRKPRVLVASPYCIFPPRHGGAIRVNQLLRDLSERYEIVLLSDEAENYPEQCTDFFRRLAAVHLVSGRREDPASDRIARIESHSHPLFVQRLKSLATWYDPLLIHLEFVELAGLIRNRNSRARWLLTLHEVLFPENGSGNDEDRFEAELIKRFDGVIACSPEDAALVRAPRVHLIPNGIELDSQLHASSCGRRGILFAGPFRYQPNFDGIRIFLEQVYPRLLATFSDLELWLLAGAGAFERIEKLSCFRQRGVVLYDYFQDPRPFLERCALTINPLLGSRGSSIKLLESIAAGRVVVSTRDGARGFLLERFPSLIVVEKIEDFQSPLERLLGDPDYRASLEPAPRLFLEKHTWHEAARALADVYSHYVNEKSSRS